jgi:hypothetical protein
MLLHWIIYTIIIIIIIIIIIKRPNQIWIVFAAFWPATLPAGVYQQVCN